MIYTAVRFKRNFSTATRLSTPTCPALSYDSSTNRLTGIGGLTIGYDAAGNQLNDQYFTYQYDAEGRVTFSNSTGQWQYPMYNALGQRIMDDQGGANPELKLTYPVDIFGQWTGTWAEYTNWTGWNVYWSQVAGQRLNMGGSSAFIDHSDAVGSTTMETDPSGAVVWDVTHYPSGKVFQEQGTRQSEVALGLDWQVNDPAIPSATREYNFRVYRWQTPDPVGGDVTNPQSLNRYAYALNNPTTLTDPLGLEGSNPTDSCSDPSYPNARCPGPPGCSFFGDPNCCPGPSIGGFSEEFCYPLSGDFPPPNQWNPLPAITQPTAAGQLGALGGGSPFGCPFPYDSMGLCGLSPNYWTGQIGASVNVDLWGWSGTYFVGFAFDLRGNLAFYHGGGWGHGVGVSGDGGVQFGDSNAYTVCGLRGPFAQASRTVGADAGGTIDVFEGKGNGPGGLVHGGTITIGPTEGVSSSAQVTVTRVVPFSGHCGPGGLE